MPETLLLGNGEKVGGGTEKLLHGAPQGSFLPRAAPSDGGEENRVSLPRGILKKFCMGDLG